MTADEKLQDHIEKLKRAIDALEALTPYTVGDYVLHLALIGLKTNLMMAERLADSHK